MQRLDAGMQCFSCSTLLSAETSALIIAFQLLRSFAPAHLPGMSTLLSNFTRTNSILRQANKEKKNTSGEQRFSCSIDLSCKRLITYRYKKTKYNDSEEQMKKYTTLMSAYGVGVGVDFNFHGTIANTFDAHRLIQHFQDSKGADTADRIVNCVLIKGIDI